MTETITKIGIAALLLYLYGRIHFVYPHEMV